MSELVLQCLNEGCGNEIPTNIAQQFKTKNDKRRVCQSCYRKHIPIRIVCDGCGETFEVNGDVLKLYCSINCKEKIGFKRRRLLRN